MKTLAYMLIFLFLSTVIVFAEPKSFTMEKDGVIYKCEPQMVAKPKETPKPKVKQKPRGMVGDPEKEEPKKEPIPVIEPKPSLNPIANPIKYNTIFFEPLLYFMAEDSTKRVVIAPGIGLSYVRRCTDRFSFGFGLSYMHATYGYFPDRTFNSVGVNLKFGINF